MQSCIHAIRFRPSKTATVLTMAFVLYVRISSSRSKATHNEINLLYTVSEPDAAKPLNDRSADRFQRVQNIS
jgi:hypothetical protein